MEKFNIILCDVWRHVSRHLRLQNSLEDVASLIGQNIPLQQLIVQQWDDKGQKWQFLAAGVQCRSIYPVKENYGKKEIRRIQSFFKQDDILHISGSDPKGATLRIFSSIRISCLDAFIAPLGRFNNNFTALLMISRENQSFQPIHAEMLQLLREPLATVLQNNLRLHEIEKLKEAAEADNVSLLARLHRKTIADVIIGEKGGLKSVLDRVSLVAQSDVPVVIFGETGTGKELIARTIHNQSDRASAPFIRVNCGAIPLNLLDSQLFGHERGAFTGAVETRKGWFEQADGGTLFLDEVGELTLDAQVRLLRVLQDGWLERVGGKNAIHVDVRIVLATHRDISRMVSEGRFREDLWYRIATFPIFLPPLRERMIDLSDLATHFAERSAIRFNLPVILPDERDIQLLASYSWPGNVRELASIMDRAALLGDGNCLEVAKALGLSNMVLPAQKSGLPDKSILQSSTVFPPLDDVVRDHIQQVLKHTHGRIEGRYGAAAILKLHPSTLRARMRKLGVHVQHVKLSLQHKNNQNTSLNN